MQNLNTRLVDDNLYVAVPEITPGHCNGCVAHGKELCSSLIDDCEGRKIIWAKQSNVNVTTTSEEPKYTVEEFSEAVSNCTGRRFFDWEIPQIKEYLDKQNNPDYKLYLKLKEQFGE